MSSKIALTIVCIAALCTGMTFATFGKKGSPVMVPMPAGPPGYLMQPVQPVQYAQLYGPVHQKQGLFSKFGMGSHGGAGYMPAYPSYSYYGGYKKPHCC